MTNWVPDIGSPVLGQGSIARGSTLRFEDLRYASRVFPIRLRSGLKAALRGAESIDYLLLIIDYLVEITASVNGNKNAPVASNGQQSPVASNGAKQTFILNDANVIIKISCMSKLVGYMVTWTTYGSWLQGDKRGFVKDGKIFQGNETIFKLCEKLQKGQTVKLKKQEKEIVRTAILNEAERIGQKLQALVTCTNHIHLVALPCDKSIERIIGMYKSVATRALRCSGRTGRIWTKGFDKRFCFTQDDLAKKIAYIQNHK